MRSENTAGLFGLLRYRSTRSTLPVLLLVALLGLSGCNTSAIHQDDLYNPPVYWGRHIVKSGETLYSIAWRYGRDYRELGNANGISAPYGLKAGQVLRLDKQGSIPKAGATVSSGRSEGASSSRPVKRPQPQKAKPVERAPTVSKPADTSLPTASRSQTVANVQWRWPHVGTVIAGYSTSGKVNKGIDIAGNPGDSVRAAASGNVVYAGDGLLGYGNLVIVNHNEHYLSAYAHNRKILVQEGETVSAGQAIAEMGNSGTDQSKLHFEIRKKGNPVDPMPYLPPR